MADVNVIDLDGLTLHGPQMIHDLPAGGQRLVQPVDGYLATIKSGQVTFEDGEPTGARPGGVLRSGSPPVRARGWRRIRNRSGVGAGDLEATAAAGVAEVLVLRAQR